MTVIEPRHGVLRLSIRELWHYRDLFSLLTTRDIRVRYQQTFFGALWAVLQPVLLMAVFTVFLGRLADVPSADVPYALFAYSGLVPWTFFSQGLSAAAASLVDNERLVTKVYFPRILVPAAAGISYVVDFAVGHVLMFAMVLYYDARFRASQLLLPAFGVGVAIAIAAIGFGLAALNVRYRDVRYAIPFAVQVLLFVTPVVYPASLVPSTWQPLYAVNPMASLVDVYRWALLGTPTMSGVALLVSVGSAAVLTIAGLAYFQRVERSFADVI